MKALFRKRLQGIFPDNEEGLKLLTKMPQGALCKVEYIKARNYENHKRFFKFIETAFDMQEVYEDPEQLRKAIQMVAGHYEELIIIGKDGEPSVHYIPKSIAFDEMDEGEFQELFKKCVNGFLSRYGKGMTEAEFMRILEFD